MHRAWKLIFLCAIFIFSGCNLKNTPPVPTFVLPTSPATGSVDGTLPWTVAVVTKGDVNAISELPGDIVAKEERSLFFTTSGLLKDVYIVPGDSVNMGDVIAELDTDILEETVLIRESELAIAIMEVSKLERQEAPNPGVTNNGSSSNYPLEIAKERAKLAEARYLFSQNRLAAAVLKAPFSGKISSFGKQRGDNVVAYETIGQIADITETSIHVMVPSAEISLISPGTPAVVIVAGRSYNAHITLIDSTSTLWQGESAHKVTIAFDAGQDLSFDINQSVDVTIAGEIKENVLLLPVEAVDIFPGQAYVDIVEGNNLRRVPVEVGISDGIYIEVLNGIEEGQIVALP